MITIARMLTASVITSLFVGIMFFLLLIVPNLISAFSLDFIVIAFFLSGYAVIVSLFIILILGIPMVMVLKYINKLNWKYLSALSFTLGFVLFYFLLKGNLFYSRPIEVYGYFSCALFGLASAITACVFYKILTIKKK